MKRIYFNLIKSLFIPFAYYFGFISNSHAQFAYTMGNGTVNYVYSSGGGLTTVFAAGEDDSYVNDVPIGFNFKYGGCEAGVFDKVHISTNGFIAFGPSLTNSIPNNGFNLLGTPKDLIAPLWDNLKVGAGGAISINLIGSPGSRVFEVEWKNMLWNNLSAAPSITFKVLLHEGTNQIEFQYKDEPASAYLPSATIGLGRSNSLGNFNTVSMSPISLGPLNISNVITTKPSNNLNLVFTPRNPQLVAPPHLVTSPVCYGDANGSITILNPEAFAGASYSWSPITATGTSVVGLPAGQYTCFYSDDAGCRDTITVNLFARNPISASLNFTDTIICKGQALTIVANATGGNGLFTYTWTSEGVLGNTLTVYPTDLYEYPVDIRDFNPDDSTYCVTTLMASVIDTIERFTLNLYDTGGVYCESSYHYFTVGVLGGHSITPTTVKWYKKPFNQNVQWTLFNSNAFYFTPTELGAGNWEVFAAATNVCDSASSAIGHFIIHEAPSINLDDTLNTCPGSPINLDFTYLPTSHSYIDFYTSENSISITNGNTFTPTINNVGLQGVYFSNLSFYDSITTCWAHKSIYVNVNDNPFTTEIYPKIGGNPVLSGKVLTFETVTQGAYLSVDSVDISNNHPVVLGGLDPNKTYIFGVLPDPNIYPNTLLTYTGSVFKWEQAWSGSGTCGSTISKTINVLTAPNATGNGNIFGNLLCVSDSGRRPGEPIRGIDIILEDRPGANVVMRTTTDNNGGYNFSNIPPGNYALYVNMPGCLHLNTYEFTITGSNTLIDLDFFVDSVQGTIDTTTFTEPIICNGILNYAVTDGCLNTPLDFINLSTGLSIKQYNFSWDFDSDNIIDSYQKGNFTHVFTSAGNYNAKLYIESIGNGNCKDTLELNFNVFPLPNLLTSVDSVESCLGVRRFVLATSADSYSWSPSFLVKVDNDSIIELNTDTVGVFNLLLYETLGACSASKTIPVIIHNLPQVSLVLDIDTACSQGGSVILSGGTPVGGSYTGNGVSSGMLDPVAAGIGSHQVIYFYSDPSTGCSNSASDYFEVVLCTGSKSILANESIAISPNPFSHRITLQNLPLGSDVKIYDYQGKLIFSEITSDSSVMINTEDFAKGLYLIKINDVAQTIVKE